MSDLAFSALGVAGLTVLNFLAPGAPQRSIGGIVAQVTPEETETNTLTITEHPVENSANITDHAIVNAAEVNLRVGWSNSGYAALGAAISAAGDATSIADALTNFTSPTYVRSVYEKLLALQASRQPFVLVTGKRTYQNMLIRSIVLNTNVESENALILNITCKQILIAQSRVSTLPAQANQQNPEATASPGNVGTTAAVPASPSSAGFLPAGTNANTNFSEIPIQNPSAMDPSTGGNTLLGAF